MNTTSSHKAPPSRDLAAERADRRPKPPLEKPRRDDPSAESTFHLLLGLGPAASATTPPQTPQPAAVAAGRAVTDARLLGGGPPALPTTPDTCARAEPTPLHAPTRSEERDAARLTVYLPGRLTAVIESRGADTSVSLEALVSGLATERLADELKRRGWRVDVRRRLATSSTPDDDAGLASRTPISEHRPHTPPSPPDRR